MREKEEKGKKTAGETMLQNIAGVLCILNKVTIFAKSFFC